MIITEYNEQWDKEASFNDGFVEGFKIGREESKLEMVRNLLALNVSLEKISKASGWSVEEILRLTKN